MPIFTKKDIQKLYFEEFDNETLFFPEGTYKSGEMNAYVVESDEDRELIYSFMKKEGIYFTIHVLLLMVAVILGLQASRQFTTFIFAFVFASIYWPVYHFRINKKLKNVKRIKVDKDTKLSKALALTLHWKVWLFITVQFVASFVIATFLKGNIF